MQIKLSHPQSSSFPVAVDPFNSILLLDVTNSWLGSTASKALAEISKMASFKFVLFSVLVVGISAAGKSTLL